MKLRYYVARRLLLSVPTLVGLTLMIFALTHIGNTLFVSKEGFLLRNYPSQSPLIVQYWYWLSAFVQGNWGYTLTDVFNGPVLDAVSLFFPNTLMLAVVSGILAAFIGVPLGVWASVNKDGILDQATRAISFVGYSIPIYWFGLILIILFASSSVCACLNVFPIFGTANPILVGGLNWYQDGISYPTHLLVIDSLLHARLDIFQDAVLHLVLPVVTLTFGIVAPVLRIMRSSMRDVLSQDFIVTARAKGLPEKVIVKAHARRAALIPVSTVIGYLIAYLLGGVILVETVFGYLGIGYWMSRAVLAGDAGAIIGGTVILGLAFIFANLVLDIAYGFLDPRLRY